MPKAQSLLLQAAAAIVLTTLTAPAQAAVGVRITIQNLSPTNSISFAPLRYGFNSGVFDSFNVGATATTPIISVAEGGSGSAWFPAFAAADPTAVLGSLGGALTPGSTVQSGIITVDPNVNAFFTFGSMVIPSNDFFIGNDDPQEYRLFDANGRLALKSINVTASEIWNAGSEAFDPANAAFLVGGTNSLRTPENGVVGFNFSELAGFNGLTTAAGYEFSSGLRANQNVYRISFSATPEPGTWAMMILGFGATGWSLRRRRAAAIAT